MEQRRTLIEGAMMAALFSIILLATLFIPILGILFLWFLPLPFIIFGVRAGLKANGITWLVAMFLALILTGPLGLLIALFFGTCGLVIGEIYRRNLGGFSQILGAGLTFTTAMVIAYVVSTAIFGIDPMTAGRDSMYLQIDFVKSTLGSMGNTEAIEQMYQMADLLLYLAPLMIVMSGVTIAVITVALSNMVLKRLGFKYKKMPPFREWKFPRSFIWYFLLVMILSLIGFEEGTTMFLAITNLYFLLGFVMIVQGFSFIFNYFHTVNKSKAWPIVIVVVCFLFSPLMEIVKILGIIDLGFDLRTWIKNKKKK
ncbi:YybS family protein [Alkalihalobacillus sp. 1P02AB]|uniref:YybS family protein n=1 Tax=Alkalihalobacillus sp. 1P02AB TaxID=3132260 RepID=UPI0039A66AE9